MSTKILSALLLASVSALAVPAYASTGYADQQTQLFNRDPAAIVASLDQKGINAYDVEKWGDYVRAFVVDKKGNTSMQFFEPDQLNRVDVN